MDHSLQTPAHHGFGLAFSPFVPNRLALASSANYGLVGNGRVSVLVDHGPGQAISMDQQFDTKDAVHAVVWSEIHPEQVVSGGGDGSVKLWDRTLPGRPVGHWLEHSREVMGVDWSNLQKETFASCSWDGSLKIWTPGRRESVLSIKAHDSCVYSVNFSPHSPHLVGSCSGSGHFKLHDLRSPAPHLSQMSIAAVPPGSEALSFDFNKYAEGVVAVSGTDKLVRVLDVRGGGGGKEVARLAGHTFPARVVKWSPWKKDVLASAGYDMTCRVWSTGGGKVGVRQLAQHGKHTEFVCGLAWSLFTEGLLMSCGWDGMVHAWRPPV